MNRAACHVRAYPRPYLCPSYPQATQASNANAAFGAGWANACGVILSGAWCSRRGQRRLASVSAICDGGHRVLACRIPLVCRVPVFPGPPLAAVMRYEEEWMRSEAVVEGGDRL